MFFFEKAKSVPAVFCFVVLSFIAACHQGKPEIFVDHPLLTSRVKLQDVTFHSAALGRDMQYRIVTPASISAGAKLPVVYLLHGGGGSFRDWTNYSDVARFAERGLILVMPDGDDSWYTNSVKHPQDRYEDYIVHDLVADVESRLPAGTGRANRAIVGISMGGFGGVKLALRYSEMYFFVGGLSSALDAPHRAFSLARIGQYRHYRSIFGPWHGPSERENDPFMLASTADPAKTPYFFLTCGEGEGLLAINQGFANLLERRHFRYEFHVVPGGHNWLQWNSRLDDCFSSLLEHLRDAQSSTGIDFPHSLPTQSLS